MENTGNNWEKAMGLLGKALTLRNAGSIEEAIALLDEAITLVEEDNIPSFAFRVQKELFANPRANFSQLVPILQEAADFYQKRGDILQHITYLLNIASGLVFHIADYEQALKYIDMAEAVINGTTSEQRANLISQHPRFPKRFVEEQLATRMNQASDLRRTIFEKKNR